MAIETERLLLRQWRDSDLAPLTEMNRDPQVMRYFPDLLTPEQSREAWERMRGWIDEHGWGLWAVEEIASGGFIGLVGLAVPRVALPFMPCVEVGWRLRPQAWGRGYASEAAKRALALAFDELARDEVVSFTSLLNLPSQRVMRRIGMRDAGRDFDHPSVPEGHPLRRHGLYSLKATEWRDGRGWALAS
ncbi:GNAT family N-acetyltransferase [Chromobacterium alticapitis]|uniref:GNAT family N-acetyltransferase n=1 Tax=Chromobacterium alticapitis TaxID=2073169 RepID=A0A2S5DKH9_9NEIS|nr:GNAT family N-acetyltransferase [Chromobacterium alticapitis]POZ63531.1 GNAT family N-acetyltransferase [Chromobacterium alticapitis]